MKKLYYKTAVTFLLLLTLLLTGCRIRRSLPFYQLEMGSPDILTVDDIRYISDWDVVFTGSGTPKYWGYEGKAGDAIGVCGGNPDKGGSYDVCRITEDEECDFLFVKPNHFVFGPYYTYLFFREDIELTPPSAKTISCIVMTVNEQEKELTDTELIAALLDFYFNDTGDDVPYKVVDENIAGITFSFHHQDYPFLTAEIKGSYHKKTGAVYLTCPDSKRREVPEDLAKLLPIEN